jgi:hypothetical protein
LRQGLAVKAGIDPESLWQIGGALGYHVDVRWRNSGVDGEIDVVFSRPDERGSMCVTDFGETHATLKRESDYANNPARAALSSKLPQILIESVKSRLPEHMAPTTVVVLDELPRTPNGKVDRKILPAPSAVTRAETRQFVAARNEKEKALAAIWSELLGLEKVSVLDSFFELGGDSLLGFRAVNRASQSGLPVTLRMLFQHKTIAEIVKALDTEGVAVQPVGATITRVSREAHKRKLASIR